MGNPGVVLPGSTPASLAALAILPPLLEVFRQRASDSQRTGEFEDVHQLRVVSRRIAAVLRTLGDCFDEKDVAKLKRRLRKVRRAAGEARNLDVFLKDLHATARRVDHRRRKSIHAIRDRAGDEREDAQRSLDQAVAELEKRDFWNWSAERFHRTTPNDASEEMLLARARRSLPPLLDEFLAYRMTPDSTDEDFHQLRIAGKRLRYAMELFHGCFEVRFTNDLLETLRKGQDILGEINDWRTFAEKMSKLRLDESAGRELREAAEHLVHLYSRRLARRRGNLLEFQREWLGERFRRGFIEIIEAAHPSPSAEAHLS